MNGDVMSMLSSIMQDPKAMEKAMSLASMLSSSGALDNVLSQKDTSDASDTQNANAVKDILSKIPDSDTSPKTEKDNSQITMNERLALLGAIRPYLSREKAAKLDGVIQVLKIVGALEKSGIKLF